MQYSSSDLDTLRIASSICNIGKLFIPSDILTKTEKLTAEEAAELLKEAEYSSQILADIEFDGPVLTTITQKHEYLDGSGTPNNLKGDEIHPLAKILAVADAFIAMTSPRAYRDKMDVQKAQDILYNDSKNRYDRSVVAGLINLIENTDILQQLEQ